MSGDDLTARLRATFILELEEQVRVLNAGLLAMEQQPSADTIRTLFRSAHTVKGAARVAGLPIIEEACHALEAIFAAVRDQARELSGSDFSLLFAVVDGLTEAADRLRAERPLDGASLTGLLPRVQDAAARGSSQEAARPANPAEREGGDATEPEPSVEETTRPPASSAPAVLDATRDGDDLVRVSAERLDALLAGVGELMIASQRVRTSVPSDDARRLGRATEIVADIVHALRLRPFGEACEALPRAVRDVATAAGRAVELDIEGGAVEADRLVVDALREPLLHLVRNAVDHGIEPPAERERAGKPRTGRVTVAAALTGGRLVVSVSDDGRGLDEEAIRATLRRRGSPEPRTRADLADALMHGGFSTRREATAISGRGVGLDVVRSALERIGGSVEVTWQPGEGTRFTLECPPSPLSVRALMVRSGQHVLAFPTLHVERLMRVPTDRLQFAEGRTLVPLREGPVPVVALASLLGPPLEARPLEARATLVLASAGSRQVAIAVDEVVAEDEIVVRPLDLGATPLPWAAGGAILPSGSVALVLNVGALLAVSGHAGTAIAPPIAPARESPRRRILVADDSITTRTLEQGVLEAAGYEVVTAVDGEDAWRQLLENGADLLVADVEMPRIDGFALCRRIRASSRFAQLPVVLVTGLESAEDRARGMEAGADAYIVKSSFDQATLIDTVRELTGA